MNKKSRAALFMGAAVVIAVIAVAGYLVTQRGEEVPVVSGEAPTSVNERGEVWHPPQGGEQVFHLASGNGQWPKFVEAVIDPMKVSVGERQTMRVVLEDDVTVTDVTAVIKTDNETIEVPLNQTEARAVTKQDIESKRYFVDEKNELVVAEPNVFGWKQLVERFFSAASAADMQRFVYEGEWFVRDTHDITYHTKFVATDELGRTSEITMAWSDPCSPYLGSAWTVASSQNCDSAAAYGPDNAGITVNTSVTLTLGVSGVTMVWGPSSSVTVNGTISIVNGAQLKQTRLWINDDDDGDCYISQASWNRATQATYADVDPGATWGAGANCGAITSPNLNDCYDLNANSHPGETAYYTVNRGDGSFDYNCNAIIEFSVPRVCDAYATGWVIANEVCGANGSFCSGLSCTICSTMAEACR